MAPIDPNTPQAAIGTKEADPTLGILPHIAAVAVGLLAGWLSTKFSVSLSDGAQEEIAVGVVTVVTTAVHWVEAKLSAARKGA